MNAALGLSFGRDRVFLVHVSRDGGVRLHAATSATPVTTLAGSASPSAGTTVMRVAEGLRAALATLGEVPPEIGVSVPASWAFVHSFPAPAQAAPAVLQERSAWETAQHFGVPSPGEYAAAVYAMDRDAPTYLSVSYPKHLIVRLHEMFDALGLTMTATMIDPFAAEQTFRENYADVDGTPTALVECGAMGGSVTITRDGRVAILAPHPSLESGPSVSSAVEQAESRAGYHAQELLVWGEELTKDVLDGIEVRKVLRRVRRMNAFRGVVPEQLSERQQAYCRRTAHLFPAAMGAALEAIGRRSPRSGTA